MASFATALGSKCSMRLVVILVALRYLFCTSGLRDSSEKQGCHLVKVYCMAAVLHTASRGQADDVRFSGVGAHGHRSRPKYISKFKCSNLNLKGGVVNLDGGV